MSVWYPVINKVFALASIHKDMDNELGILPNALNVPQDPIFEKMERS